MTPDLILIALFTGVCGLTFIIGTYEAATGRMPGIAAGRGVGAYRWLSTPTRVRLASVAGLLVLIGFFVVVRPLSPVDLVAGGIGVLAGIFVTLGDARSYH